MRPRVDLHSTDDGDDCHADCCPICNLQPCTEQDIDEETDHDD
jgi:hypothetical protein